MKKIHPKNLPFYMPLRMTAIVYLLYDNLIQKFDVSAMQQGIWLTIAILIVGIYWLAFIVGIFNNDLVDIFDEKEALGRALFDGTIKRALRK